MELSIVIPTRNEKDNIFLLIDEIRNKLEGIKYEIIFVDDSTDGTEEEIKKYRKKNIILEHRINEKGLSSAVIRGMQLANSDIIAVMDADLQHPPYLLKNMYQEIVNGADMCIPSRFIKGGSDGGLNWYRKLVSSTARNLGKVYLPHLNKISDITSGIFCFRKKNVNIEKLNPIGWKILLEVLTKSTYKTIVEIPYCFCKRNACETKMNKRAMLDYLKQISLLKKEQMRNDYQVIKREEGYCNDTL